MKKGLLLIVFVFCLLVFRSNAFACSCDLNFGESFEKQVQSAQKGSTAIFSGTVTEITQVPYGLVLVPGTAYSLRIKSRLDRSWKGPTSEEIIISTGSGGGDCGFPFEIGESYLVYAYGSSIENLSTNICQRTGPLGAGTEDVKILGDGKAVQKKNASGMSPASSGRWVNDPEAYAIYSLLIPNQRPVREGRAKKLVIPAETQGHPEITECLERDPSHDRTLDPLVLAYQEANKTPWQLQRKFDISLPYEIVPEESFRFFFEDPNAQGWKEFYKKYPDSGGAFAISAVGFNPAKTRALVYIGYGCGYLCGRGGYHMLEKTDAKWNEIPFMPGSYGCGSVS